MFALDVPEHLDHLQRRKSAIFVPGNKTEQNLYDISRILSGAVIKHSIVFETIQASDVLPNTVKDFQ